MLFQLDHDIHDPIHFTGVDQADSLQIDIQSLVRTGREVTQPVTSEHCRPSNQQSLQSLCNPPALILNACINMSVQLRNLIDG
ncbi:hypothetical protein B9Z34_10545 [Limnohabitans sp. Hippo3]|nr:hypothetical protein B9Z34_10545 [Limnohabitans sp. Hippo3]